jgi:hypothetical protein
VCQQGTRLTNNILKLQITTKKSSLESVRQIIRQKLAKASGVSMSKRSSNIVFVIAGDCKDLRRKDDPLNCSTLQSCLANTSSAILIAVHETNILEVQLRGDKLSILYSGIRIAEALFLGQMFGATLFS